MNKTIGKININSSLHKWILLIAFFIYPKLIFSEWTAVNSPVGGAVLTLINKDGLLFANAFGAGIYKSTNNGRIWEQATNAIPNLRFSTSIASNSNYIYASSARSGIFRSSDNGASWQEIHDGKITPCRDIGKFMSPTPFEVLRHDKNPRNIPLNKDMLAQLQKEQTPAVI